MIKKTIILFCLILSIFITGCKLTGTIISPVVLQTFVKEEKRPKSYYSKEILGYINDVMDESEISYTTIERWVKKTEYGYKYKQRIMIDKNESYVTVYNDGIETVKSKTETGEIKYSRNIIKENYVEAVLTSEKDIFLNEVSMLAETHDMNIIGSEKIAGKDTLHIEYDLKSAEKAKNIGNTIDPFNQYKRVELWVDKDNYKIMKSIRTLPDEIGITHKREILEYNDKLEIPDSIFEMEIPENTEIESSILVKAITESEFIYRFGNELLYLNTKEPWEVSYKYSEKNFGDVEPYIEIEASHFYEDKIQFKIVINKPALQEYKADLKRGDSSTIIHNTNVSYIKNRNLVHFKHNDYDYKILSFRHNLSRDELYKIAEDLLKDAN